MEDILSEIGSILNFSNGVTSTTRLSCPEDSFTVDEKTVYDCLSDVEPVHIDTIVLGTGLSGTTILTTLLGLELSNHVEQLAGKQFRRKYPLSTIPGP